MKTGYPSIDKPWLKYYSEEMINAVQPSISMYQYIYNNNSEYGNNVALDYFGKKITYNTLLKKIKEIAKGFKKIGVKKGSVVTIMSMQTPETIMSIYALNYLGAVANMIYMTLPSNGILEYIHKTKSVLFMYLEIAADRIASIKEEIDVPVVCLSVSDSMPVIPKMIVKLKKKSRLFGLKFSELVSEGKEECLGEASNFGEDPAVIVYTSGTTGEPKGVVHTNNSLNAVPFQYMNAGMNLNHGDTFLNAIPPFLGFGISVGMHAQLALGTHGILQIVPEAKAVAKKFIKSKPDHMIIGPAFVTAITEACVGNMSWLKTMAGGGGAISEEQEEELNLRLKNCNSSVEYIAGYGMTEFGATVCTNMNRCNRMRSLGIPFAKTNIKVIDPETQNELKYDETGELCFNTPNMMREYWGSNSVNQFLIIDGIRWLRTGDLGHVDQDGFVFFDGRLKRIHITRGADGVAYKVFPQRVEDAIYQNNKIEFCATIGVEDKERITLLISIVKTKAGEICSQDEIIGDIKNIIPEYSLPQRVIFVDEMPITQSGKIDYQALMKKYAEY